MKKINPKRLGIYILISSIIPGVGNAIVSPEPTLLQNIGYGLFMGCILGGVLYYIQDYRQK